MNQSPSMSALVDQLANLSTTRNLWFNPLVSSRYSYQPGPSPSPSSRAVNVTLQTNSPGVHSCGTPPNHSLIFTLIGFVSGCQLLNGGGPNTSIRYLYGATPAPKLSGGSPMRPVI